MWVRWGRWGQPTAIRGPDPTYLQDLDRDRVYVLAPRSRTEKDREAKSADIDHGGLFESGHTSKKGPTGGFFHRHHWSLSLSPLSTIPRTLLGMVFRELYEMCRYSLINFQETIKKTNRMLHISSKYAHNSKCIQWILSRSRSTVT